MFYEHEKWAGAVMKLEVTPTPKLMPPLIIANKGSEPIKGRLEVH
jgi:hypothetical protein